MALKIMVAKIPKLIDEALKNRYQVFIEEKYLIDAIDERFIDRFDTYPTSTHLVVKNQEDYVVGSLRMTLDSPVGLPSDEVYPFRQHIPETSRLMSCSMHCVFHAYRTDEIIIGMMLMASYFAKHHAITHILAPTKPEIADLLEKIGFQKIGGVITETKFGMKIQPLLLDLEKNLNDFFLNFIKKNQIQALLEKYERVFYQAGEYIVREGEKGEQAFFIIEGTVHVKFPHSNKILAELKPGELFGELALITDEIRSADVIAITDLQVMTISKAAFMEFFLTNSQELLGLMKLIGNRTKGVLNYLEKQTRKPIN